jgi:hypothetical protein
MSDDNFFVRQCTYNLLLHIAIIHHLLCEFYLFSKFRGFASNSSVKSFTFIWEFTNVIHRICVTTSYRKLHRKMIKLRH